MKVFECEVHSEYNGQEDPRKVLTVFAVYSCACIYSGCSDRPLHYRCIARKSNQMGVAMEAC